jgi:serine/threonine protein kinase
MSGLGGDHTDSERRISSHPHLTEAGNANEHLAGDPQSSASAHPAPRAEDGSSTQPREIIIDGADIRPDDPTVVSNRPPVTPQTSLGGATPGEIGDLLEGERLGHFELEKFIGGGGMGAVFRGTDTALGRTVAVKVLLRQYGSDEETTRRFQNEAQSAARLDHENIARVYHVGEDRGWHYIVLEFIKGENLRDLISRTGTLSLTDFILFALQITEALGHASQRDVVHRDIKPSNVLVSTDGRVKLVDMGLARLHQVENSQDDLTASGVTLGTFDYISPEQARDPRSADVRSDLYSLGCTLHYMVAGRPPFPEGTVLQKLLQHQGDEPPDVREFRPDLPDPICRIIKKLLAKSPADRYQTPVELASDLVVVSQQFNIHRPSPREALFTTIANEHWFRRHLPWAVPLAILLVTSLVVHFSSVGQTAVIPQRPKPHVEKKDAPPTEISKADLGSSPDEVEDKAGDSQADVRSTDEPSSDSNKDSVSESDGSADHNTAIAEKDPPDDGAKPMPPDSSAMPTNPQLVVDGVGGVKGVFESVSDAVRSIPRDVDTGVVTIELRYNGRLTRPERSIVLKDKYTIRAGAGFRPVIYFRPEAEDPELFEHSMIIVSAGGSLALSNVQIELDLSSNANSDGWTLIEPTLAKEVRLIRCWLTIRNTDTDLSALYKDVSFFRFDLPPGGADAVMDENSSPMRTMLDLRNCVARGEATFLRGAALDTVELYWSNGLLASSERFVELVSRSAAISSNSELDVRLEHVTAGVTKGFCSMDRLQDQPFMPTMRLNCRECILITTDAPLIEQSGPESIEKFKDHVRWTANQNFYERCKVFWKIDSFADGPTELTWSDWQQHWGDGERPDRPASVQWTTGPPGGISLADHTPDDYELMEDESNPAVGAASDTSDAGLNAKNIPDFLAPIADSGDEPPAIERRSADDD